MQTLSHATTRLLAHHLTSPSRIKQLENGLKVTLFIDGQGNLIAVKNTVH